MKKLLSVILTLTLLCGCNLTVLAETMNSAGDQTTDVYAEFEAGTKSSTIFTVDIEWSAMDFKYYEENEPVWDPSTHTYSEPSDASWEGTGSITITNHTNAPITAKPSYTALEAYSDANVAFNTLNLFLDSAEIGNEAKTGTITVTPYGALPEMNEKTKIGSITLSLSSLDIEDATVDSAEAKKAELEQVIADVQSYATGVENSTEIVSGRYYLNSDLANANTALTELTTVLNNFKAGEATQKELNYAYSKANFCTSWFGYKTK